MNWKANIMMGRINYQLQLPRDKTSLPDDYAELPFVPIIPLESMVSFAYSNHNDDFVLQRCTDPAQTITNHRDGLTIMTQATIDVSHLLRNNQLVTLDNLNIQRQHGVPELGLTYNIDQGGMIDEYLIISRRPLVDTTLPSNGVPKAIPGLFGLDRTGWTFSEMRDVILCEKRRYQPDSRFVATQPIEAASTYGDLGDPAINPQDAVTRRYVSLTLSDVESWGDTSLPINGPTIYVYRYFEMFIADRGAQRLGTLNGGQFYHPAADNLTYLEMRVECRFPQLSVTMTGTKKDASLGELAVAYERDVLRGPGLKQEPKRPERSPLNVDEEQDNAGRLVQSVLEDFQNP